jgi:hypothetical protein
MVEHAGGKASKSVEHRSKLLVAFQVPLPDPTKANRINATGK